MPKTNSPSRSIDAIILAGGRGRRVSSQDKGLMLYRGTALIELAIQNIKTQCQHLVISCNRNIEHYKKYHYPIAQDQLSEHYSGPLAGIHAASKLCSADRVFVSPCDTPNLPTDLVQKLNDELDKTNSDIAVVYDGSRRQNLHMLVQRACFDSLPNYLDSGQRKVQNWQNSFKVVEVICDQHSETWLNLNELEQFGNY